MHCLEWGGGLPWVDVVCLYTIVGLEWFVADSADGCGCDDGLALAAVVGAVHLAFVGLPLGGVAFGFFALVKNCLVLFAACSAVGELAAFYAGFADHRMTRFGVVGGSESLSLQTAQ